MDANIFRRGGVNVFPLYLYDPILFGEDEQATRRPNLSPEFIADMERRLGLKFIPDGTGDLQATFGPEDVFHYIYAVLHSPTYRKRYAEFLKMDFPRVPLTSDLLLFRALCGLGSELVGLHTMEDHGPEFTRFDIDGDCVVDKVRYTEPGQGSPEGRVWINDSQYFEGVPPQVWEFHIGGYQVCEKWLKDRKGRTLSYDDLTHYQHVVSALSETIRLMAEIDKVIPGWPLP